MSDSEEDALKNSGAGSSAVKRIPVKNKKLFNTVGMFTDGRGISSVIGKYPQLPRLYGAGGVWSEIL